MISRRQILLAGAASAMLSSEGETVVQTIVLDPFGAVHVLVRDEFGNVTGDANSVQSVAVTASNSRGDSKPVSVNLR